MVFVLELELVRLVVEEERKKWAELVEKTFALVLELELGLE